MDSDRTRRSNYDVVLFKEVEKETRKNQNYFLHKGQINSSFSVAVNPTQIP
jgi:hypothetical protein